MTKTPKLLFDTVVSITPVGRRQCYDFEIPTHHNYFANQILVHNSGALEELADCVVMCWWEELGSEEKPKGLKYWFLIEKQRHGPPGQMIPVRFDPHRLTFHAVADEVAEWANNGAPVQEV